jgi:uncharacterized protein YbcI
MSKFTEKSEVSTADQEKKVASGVGRLLRDSFGRGPEAAHTKLADNYVLILLKGFLSPMEKIIVDEKGPDALHSIREMMMEEITTDIRHEVEKVTGYTFNDFFFDWNIDKKTGILIGLKPYAYEDAGEYSYSLVKDFPHKDALEEKIAYLSSLAERRPDSCTSVKIDKRTYLVVREGILVAIEKKMIEMGMENSLKVAKRDVEKDLLNESDNLSSILGVQIDDIFVDWNFKKDLSTIVIITEESQD